MASEAGPASRRFGPYPRFASSRWLIAACWAFVFVAAFFDLTIVPLNLAVFYLVPLSFLLMSGRGRKSRRRLPAPLVRLVHIVASDAHSTDRRPQQLAEAREWVRKSWGTEAKAGLFDANPVALVGDQVLPWT
jgi:Capsular polysaccharide synthesis, CpsB/CapC